MDLATGQSALRAFVSTLLLVGPMTLHCASVNASGPVTPAQSQASSDVAPAPPTWPTPAQHFSASRSGSLPDLAIEPSPLAVADDEKKYVLQVGAFRQLADAQRAASNIEREELRIVATRRAEQDWYVLVLGSYAEMAEARAAGEVYLSAYPKGLVWVRAAADLRKSLVNQ